MDTESAPSFDRATYTTGSGGTPCARCKAPIRDQYWRVNNQVFCATCQGQIAAAIDGARAKGSFGRAVLLGGAVALGCGIAYGIFAQVSHMQLSLITIAIAWVIAKVVRRASGGLSGRRFQILAVVLTYVASAMGYSGAVLHGISRGASRAHAKQGTVAGDSAPPPTTPPPTTPPTIDKADDAKVAHPSPGAGAVVITLLLVFGLILAAPVLVATQAPIGLVIILIGLYQAWKLARPVVIALDGPYDISSGAAPST